MKIISQNKDYYDYLQFVYGQDENVVYDRDLLVRDWNSPLIIREDDRRGIAAALLNVPVPRGSLSGLCFSRELYGSGYRLTGIHVLGKAYPVIVRMENGFCGEMVLVTPKNMGDFFEARRSYGIHCGKYRLKIDLPDMDTHDYMKDITGAVSIGRQDARSMITTLMNPSCDRHQGGYAEIIETLNAPVFQVVHDFTQGRSHVLNRVPVLKDVKGLVGQLPAPEKIYQDICNFLISRRKSPDRQPPVDIDEKSRILKAGFDLKSSFRHPVK